jgi:hypothetical protein
MVVSTTVGPLEPSTRDELAEYRDEQSLPSYNEALKSLLADADGAECGGNA